MYKIIQALSLKKIGILAASLGLMVLVAVVLMRSGPLAPVQVVMATVQEGRLQPGIFGVGIVEARRSWMVGPTSAGRVLSVKADVGDVVKTGQLLAEIDSVDISLRIEASQATVERASSALAAAKAQLADASARRELANVNARRNQELADQQFISAGALEARLQEKSSADAGYQVAIANLDAAGKELSRTRAEREALVRQRANFRLLSPSQGMVLSRDAEAGSTVVAGQAVLRLVDPNSLWVKMRVEQGRSAGLAPGLPARITLRSQPQVILRGRVARVELQADSITEERIAQVEFEPGTDTAGMASIGETAEITLDLPATAPALVVPNAALQRLDRKVGVWRLREGKLAYAQIRLGVTDLQGQVQVLEGLQRGDSIVVYSQKSLTEGIRFKVVPSLTGDAGRSASP